MAVGATLALLSASARAAPPVADAARTAWVLDVERHVEANLARIRAA